MGNMESAFHQISEPVPSTTDSLHDKHETQENRHPIYIFIDTETTGRPRCWNASPHDTDNWPRLVQIAWAIYDADGRPMGTTSFIVKPNGFAIPDDAQRIHGISTARAMALPPPKHSAATPRRAFRRAIS